MSPQWAGIELVEAGAPFRLMAVLEANQENLVVVVDVDKRPLATPHVPPSLLLVGSLWCSFFSGKRAIIKGPHSSFSISAPSCRRVAKGKQREGPSAVSPLLQSGNEGGVCNAQSSGIVSWRAVESD